MLIFKVMFIGKRVFEANTFKPLDQNTRQKESDLTGLRDTMVNRDQIRRRWKVPLK